MKTANHAVNEAAHYKAQWAFSNALETCCSRESARRINDLPCPEPDGDLEPNRAWEPIP
jgi:hypothetical protein